MVKTVFVVAAALTRSDGRILIAQRPEGKAMAGLWEFPGGKVEPGETPEAALIRELDEELGITVQPDALAPLTFASHTYAAAANRPAFHLFMPLYGCKHWHGEPKAHEHQTLEWVLPDALKGYPMPEADVPLVHWLVSFVNVI